METITITWRDSTGTKMSQFVQEIVTSELAGYATSKAIEAVKVALVAEEEPKKDS